MSYRFIHMYIKTVSTYALATRYSVSRTSQQTSKQELVHEHYDTGKLQHVFWHWSFTPFRRLGFFGRSRKLFSGGHCVHTIDLMHPHNKRYLSNTVIFHFHVCGIPYIVSNMSSASIISNHWSPDHQMILFVNCKEKVCQKGGLHQDQAPTASNKSVKGDVIMIFIIQK